MRQPSSPRSSSYPAATFLYRQSGTKTRRDGHRAAASPEADRTRAASPAADDAPRQRRRPHHSRRLSRAHVRASHAFLRLAFLQLLYAFQGLVRGPRASPIGSEAASRISLNYWSSHGFQIVPVESRCKVRMYTPEYTCDASRGKRLRAACLALFERGAPRVRTSPQGKGACRPCCV